MKTTRANVNGDRYRFDFQVCPAAKGWAQLDTGQDAACYGGWANPTTLSIVLFAEGDVTILTAETDREFSDEVRSIATWNIQAGHGFAIDAPKRIISAFRALGLGDLLH